ncbi:MAG: hypothetical protein QG635_770 [Bacteroidota bacterium]|nr:hypothetical protein [Bacteroidota bacterium]
MKKIIYIMFFLFSSAIYCQSLTVFDVATWSFPKLQAKFFAIDASGNQILNLSPADFLITENGQPRTITNVSCPAPAPPQALSSVLVMDASGSMRGYNLNLAKEAAIEWIKYLPLGKSECALTAFDSKNYLIQEFSTDRNLLEQKVNTLFAKGGTNYNAAFLSSEAGGLIISKSGKYKKVIVFLSDGLPNSEPLLADIITEANAQDAAIYTVILGMSCSLGMKEVSTMTGGLWFEKITTIEQIRQVYQQILQIAQGGNPCVIDWLSYISCQTGLTNLEVKLLINNTNAKLTYEYPYYRVASLGFSPLITKFLNAEPGIEKRKTISVTAKNADFNVTDIISSNSSFDINPKVFSVKAGKSVDLTISFFPADSGYIFNIFEFKNNLCPAKYYASGGFPGIKAKIQTLKLIRPNGGEEFVVGSDTLITWEGVPPNKKVTLEYSTNNGKNWLFITDTARGYNYNWRIPKTPSNQCLARVTANVMYNILDIEMVAIPPGTFQMGNTGAYQGEDDEKPVHTVTLTKGFFMSKYEIIQCQFEEVMDINPSYFKGDSLPIDRVTWNEAIEFCNLLSEREGLQQCYSGSGYSVVCDFTANGYRLPTEAEWEYACRAGTTTDIYSGDIVNEYCEPLDSNLDSIAWYCGNSGNPTAFDSGYTHIVGQKAPNSFGLYDMSGNVWEWCWDSYSAYSSAPVTDPTGSQRSGKGLVRGGSWVFDAHRSRSSDRYTTNMSRDYSIGFRIVRNY